MVAILNAVAPDWRTYAIHESSPSLDYFAAEASSYTSSFLLEGIDLGEKDEAGRLSQDLEALTFDDRSFDLFITQDVLEHVLAPDRAMSEIMRVLRPGGLHVFTTPKHKHLLQSRPRAIKEEGAITYLLEPEYHGNPVGDGRSLVTWDYGADFEDLASRWSGYLTSTFTIRDRERGIDGEYLEVFVAKKSEVNRVG